MKMQDRKTSIAFCGSVHILDTTPCCLNTQSLWLQRLKYYSHGCRPNILKHHVYRVKGCVSPVNRIMSQILNSVKPRQLCGFCMVSLICRKLAFVQFQEPTVFS